MGTLYINNDETWNELKQRPKIPPIPTNVPGWDTLFGGIRQGSVYIICAERGTGKTSFLIAMAKQMTKLGNRTLYISIEQNIDQLLDYIPRLDNLDVFTMETMKDWDTIKEIAKNYDFIFYDYLGAISEFGESSNMSEWQVLKKDSADLGEIAKIYNVGIITACQGKDGLNSINDSEIKHNADFVSYGKGMIDKAAGATYLIRRPNDKLYLKEFKNRYGAINMMPQQIKINLERKEFMAF